MCSPVSLFSLSYQLEKFPQSEALGTQKEEEIFSYSLVESPNFIFMDTGIQLWIKPDKSNHCINLTNNLGS